MLYNTEQLQTPTTPPHFLDTTGELRAPTMADFKTREEFVWDG
jgi:hypothetical protein